MGDSEDTPAEKHATLPIKSGLIYRIVVLSYAVASAQAFELIVDVEPLMTSGPIAGLESGPGLTRPGGRRT